MALASTLVHVNTGQGFKREPKGQVVKEESAKEIQEAWSENMDELINAFKGERWHRINIPVVTMSTPYL